MEGPQRARSCSAARPGRPAQHGRNEDTASPPPTPPLPAGPSSSSSSSSSSSPSPPLGAHNQAAWKPPAAGGSRPGQPPAAALGRHPARYQRHPEPALHAGGLRSRPALRLALRVLFILLFLVHLRFGCCGPRPAAAAAASSPAGLLAGLPRFSSLGPPPPPPGLYFSPSAAAGWPPWVGTRSRSPSCPDGRLSSGRE